MDSVLDAGTLAMSVLLSWPVGFQHWLKFRLCFMVAWLFMSLRASLVALYWIALWCAAVVQVPGLDT